LTIYPGTFKFNNFPMSRLLYFFVILTALIFHSCYSQNHSGTTDSGKHNSQTFVNTNFHRVEYYGSPTGNKVKNIILMIGDGMGTTQVQAGFTANKGQLNIQNCPVTGFIKTSASNSYTTDSAAASTAFACGVKTYNGAIGVSAKRKPVTSILETANSKGMKTGLVATCRITHATPAAFIAHQQSRNMYEEIAGDFLNTPIDVFIGGGRENFDKRKDGRNLLSIFSDRGYSVVTSTDSLEFVRSGKLAGLIHDGDQPRMSGGRGQMLGIATAKSLELLDNENGFFLMIEGSQIDWGGHANKTDYLVEEMLDFDKAIGQVLEFAAKDGETLVIITADHETGGFSIVKGNARKATVKGSFSTAGHTPVMVPVYAFGPSSELFQGIYENTEIYHKMVAALGF